MRQIKKSAVYTNTFNAWAKKNKLRVWEDFSAPSSPYHSSYRQTREHIFNHEQDGLSAYTEKPLKASSTHIDHFRKKSLYPKLTFDYANFLVDERNDNYGACFKDGKAGVVPATFDGNERIFCPVTEDMSQYVDFTFKGVIIPKSNLTGILKKRVNNTINAFNLIHPSLNEKRRELIEMVREYKKYGFADGDIRSFLKARGFPTVIEWALRLPMDL